MFTRRVVIQLDSLVDFPDERGSISRTLAQASNWKVRTATPEQSEIVVCAMTLGTMQTAGASVLECPRRGTLVSASP